MIAAGMPFSPVARSESNESSLSVYAHPPCGPAATAPSAATNPQAEAGRAPHRRILIATQLAHSVFLQGITRYARENQWQLITDMLHTGTLPQRWDGDGIIAFVPYQSDIAAYVAGTRMPCVTVSMTDECVAVPRIQPDNHEIGRLAADHLLQRNCRHFIWAPFIDDRQNAERYCGFLSEIQSHGCSCQVLPTAHRRIGANCQDDWPSWRRLVAEQLGRSSERTGLFAFNDCLSAELASIALELKIRVPQDLAILGAGNEAIECESATVTLTSVDPNLEEMAYQAAHMLAEILDGKRPAAHTTKVRPRSIEVRESTAMTNLRNPRIERALARISEGYADPNLTVGSLADALDISRRQLERDFRNESGCTAREYIESTRMQEAARLLRKRPNATIAEIAEDVGIPGTGNFFRIFRKRFGTTPSAYRAQAI